MHHFVTVTEKIKNRANESASKYIISGIELKKTEPEQGNSTDHIST